ncbi:hypothetical protein GJ496_006256 [Pomphorhynchus laevis]|nr:hypothetical protein GJ496_006256 [Pomphorhynchus laevis]
MAKLMISVTNCWLLIKRHTIERLKVSGGSTSSRVLLYTIISMCVQLLISLAFVVTFCNDRFPHTYYYGRLMYGSISFCLSRAFVHLVLINVVCFILIDSNCFRLLWYMLTPPLTGGNTYYLQKSINQHILLYAMLTLILKRRSAISIKHISILPGIRFTLISLLKSDIKFTLCPTYLRDIDSVTLTCLLTVSALKNSMTNQINRPNQYRRHQFLNRLLNILIYLSSAFLSQVKHLSGQNAPDENIICKTNYQLWGLEQCPAPKILYSRVNPIVVWILCAYLVDQLIGLFYNYICMSKVIHVEYLPGSLVNFQIKNSKPKPNYGQYVSLKCWNISGVIWYPIYPTHVSNETLNFTLHAKNSWTCEFYSLCVEPSTIKLSCSLPIGRSIRLSTSIKHYIFVIQGELGALKASTLIQAEYARIKRIYWIHENMKDCNDGINNCYTNKILPSLEKYDIEICIYVCSGWDSHTARMITLEANEIYDHLTGLHSRTRYGKPDFDKELKSISNDSQLKQCGIITVEVRANFMIDILKSTNFMDATPAIFTILSELFLDQLLWISSDLVL